MATKPPRTVKIIPQVARPRKPKISHTEKLRFISQYKRVADPTNKASVTRQFKALKQFPLHLLKPANKIQIKELKKRGFFTTTKGVIIDGPRDAKRQPIKGAKMHISPKGDIVFSAVKQRRDYIIGMTKAEKKEFAKDPNKFIEAKKKELKKRYPNIRNAKDIQTRLQWGAYQSTKDYYPSYFTRTGTWEGATREGKIKNASDKLTGLHIVVHVVKKRTKAKKRAKKAKH